MTEQARMVMSEGLLSAPIFIIGEAPGATELNLNRPFVGPAGLVR